MANKENIKKWVAGLRSARFKQLTGKLGTESQGHCCLGVACEIAIENNVPISRRIDKDGTLVYGDHRESLPLAVSQWLGLGTDDEVTLLVNNGQITNAIELNDTGTPFPKIADIVRQNFL